MKRFFAFVPALVLALFNSGCIENPLYDDDCYYGDAPPTDTYVPPGPPAISGQAVMTSGLFVTGRGGMMTVEVRVDNAPDVQMAYDIQAEVIVSEGLIEIGRASVYLGDLRANQWTDGSVDISVSAYPASRGPMTLVLTWWDGLDNMYRREFPGVMLWKSPA